MAAIDLHSVPFPTSHQPEDPPFIDKTHSVPPRLHSTPSLPNLVVPHHYTFLPHIQGPARHRPHLRPLDLASSPSTSPSKRDGLPDYSRRPSLLTPPLTPSSFRSAINDTPSTPPEPRSPLRWAGVPDHDRALASVHSAYATSLKTLMGASKNTTAHNGGYLTPASARSQSLSSDDGPALLPGNDVSALASGLASAEITPRGDDRSFHVIDQDILSDLGQASVDSPTRLLLVQNIPSSASTQALREVFCSMGEVKGIFARHQATHGFVVIAFYDARDAARAMKRIAGNMIPTLGDARLAAAFVRSAQVEKLCGKSDFLSDLDGSFFVSVEAQTVVPNDIQNMFSAFGEIASFSTPGDHSHDQTFHVEYHDCRAALSACQALNGRSMFCGRIVIYSNKEMLEYPIRLMKSDGRSTDADCQSQCVNEDHIRPRSVSVSGGVGTPDALRRAKNPKEVSQDRGRRSSNDLFFDAVGKVYVQSHATSARPRSISASDEGLAGRANMSQPMGYVVPRPYPHAEPHYYGYAHPGTVQVPPLYSPQPFSYPMYGTGMYGDATRNGYQWTYTTPPQADHYHSHQSVPRPMYPFPWVPADRPSERAFQRDTPEDSWGNPDTQGDAYADTPAQGFGGQESVEAHQSVQRVPGAKNVLDIAAIENGMDTRTTVMIKNIPNKMNDRDLKGFIDRVSPRRIDFMYLRMDFQNGCNVGYAFVNFIKVQDLLHFAKTQMGRKWNMYSSEKTLQMCYATYQGKESLIEKFKNSCIMDEKEAWRPKIYYSDGPMEGLPEPFPAPTHLRRKERSHHNRGALFVPGAHHQLSGGGAPYNHRPLHAPRMSRR